jgi:hypothetical protein
VVLGSDISARKVFNSCNIGTADVLTDRVFCAMFNRIGFLSAAVDAAPGFDPAKASLRPHQDSLAGACGWKS